MLSNRSACATVRGKPSRMKLQHYVRLVLLLVVKRSRSPLLAFLIGIKLVFDHVDHDLIAD